MSTTNHSSKGKSGKRSNYEKGRNTNNYSKKRGKVELEKNMDNHYSEPINDASYYFTDDNLRTQLTNFSFNQFLGIPTDLGKDTRYGKQYVDKVANVARFLLSPSAGWTDSDNPMKSGINQAGFKNYLLASFNNAKTTKYAPQDMTTLILAWGQLLAMLGWGARAFGLSMTYNNRNRAYPKDIVKISGFEPEDFFNNMASYRIKYNTLIAQISAVPIPANIAYFDKCANMYSGIYLDQAGSSMAQNYIFAPATTWKFDDQYSEEGTGLRTVNILKGFGEQPKDCILFSEYLDLVSDMILALTTSETLNSIYADILRLQSKNGLPLRSIGTVPETYAVLPSFIEELSLWINNMDIIGDARPTAEQFGTGFTNANDVVPSVNKNCVVYRPQFGSNVSSLDNGGYVNFSTDSPTDEMKIYATRLACRTKDRYDSSYDGYVTVECALPDHYCNSMQIYTCVEGDTPSVLNFTTNILSYWQQHLDVIADLSKFDWSPYIYIVDPTNDKPLVGCVGDLQYFTTLDYEYIKRLDDATYIALTTIR